MDTPTATRSSSARPVFSSEWTNIEIRLQSDESSKVVSIAPKEYLRIVKDHAMASKARKEAREAYAARVGKAKKEDKRSDVEVQQLV